MVLKWSWKASWVLLNPNFYRNSFFVVPVILNNLYGAVAAFWHLLTSSPGMCGGRRMNPPPGLRKGQVILISQCKRALCCRNQISKVWVRSNIFQVSSGLVVRYSLVWCFFTSCNSWTTCGIVRFVEIDFAGGDERTERVNSHFLWLSIRGA